LLAFCLPHRFCGFLRGTEGLCGERQVLWLLGDGGGGAGQGRTAGELTGNQLQYMEDGRANDTDMSVFLFGDAHTQYSGAVVGSVFALFNGNVRMDNEVPLGFDRLAF
jgi:hypothetical protein